MSLTANPTNPEDGVCWITGASSGIGLSLAKYMARQGWRVVVSARSAHKLDALCASDLEHFIAYPLDISDPHAVQNAVDEIETQHGPIACAVLCAGIYLPVHAHDPVFADFQNSFDVNLSGTAACLSAVTPYMIKRRAGQIAIVSSATGFGGMPTASAYGATKAALINMAESLRIELARYQILIQCITPGFVETAAQDTNDFPKPFMISADEAALRIAKGMRTRAFEVSFPKRFTWVLKLIYALPRRWHIGLVRQFTGWDKPV